MDFDCLVGFIGLSHNVSGEVPSGLYADTLPDISESHIEKLVDGEKDVAELWREIERRAILKFRTFFIRAVNESHRISNCDKCECLICEHKDLLATSLWYLLGEEIMTLRSNSSRMNTYTTIDKAKAKDMRADFHDAFMQELETAVHGIDVHSSKCFECDKQPQNNDVIVFREPVI